MGAVTVMAVRMAERQPFRLVFEGDTAVGGFVGELRLELSEGGKAHNLLENTALR